MERISESPNQQVNTTKYTVPKEDKRMENGNDNIELKIILGAKRTRVVAYEGMEIKVPSKSSAKDEQIKMNLGQPSPYAVLNYMRRMKDRKDNFYSIVYNNFQANHAVMLTLTFSSNNLVYCNLDQAHKEFVKFIKRLNWYYNGFKYAATFSRQKNGNWHYHMICNITDMDQKQWMKVWKHGLVWVSFIPNEGVLREKAVYCVKNMVEVADNDLHREKGYLCSQGLQRNLVFRSWNPVEAQTCWDLFEQIKEEPKTELYSTSHPINEQEEWTFHYIRSLADFSDLFPLLESATRKTDKKE